MKRITIAFTVATLLLATATTDATARIRVKCEKRANRSSISVDGRNLEVGNYSANVLSGDNEQSAPLKPSVGDEAEFDFDSARRDIAAGDTPIPAGFVQGGRVTAQILDEEGFVVAEGSATCRVR